MPFRNRSLWGPLRTVMSSEFQVPVPWGHIAGKQWGSSDGEPWICVHGWLDNCGSFDRLAPYFPPEKRLICFDVPGHGFSSHYPPGMLYNHIEGIRYIQTVAKHFTLDKFNLMGHSMGGSMCMLYTATFPENVEALVMLDCVKPTSRTRETVVDRTREAFQNVFSIEEKLASGKPRIYSPEDARKRHKEGIALIMNDNTDGMTEEALDCLAERGMKKVEGGYVFTRDLKHRIRSLYGYPTDVYVEFAKHVKCPHLIVRAKKQQGFEPEEEVQMVLEQYEASNGDNFVTAVVEGNHNVHMNNPEAVWAVIDKFLANVAAKRAKSSL